MQEEVEQKVRDFCRLFYQSTFIPVSGVRKDGTVFAAEPGIPGTSASPAGALFSELSRRARAKNPNYLVCDCFAYLGICSVSDTFIVVGPVLSTRYSEDTIHGYLRESGLPVSSAEALRQFFYESPQVSFGQLLNTLLFVHYSLNGEALDYASHFSGEAISRQQRTVSLVGNGPLLEEETKSFHNTWYFEQEYLSLIRQGQPEKLRELMLRASNGLRPGTTAGSALRQTKNIFIASITLATRAAIEGGVPMETAYELSDHYIQQAEKMQRGTDIEALESSALLDFAGRASHTKIPEGMSREMYQVVQFVQNNIDRPIQVEDCAAAIGRSRSYTSRKFKQEMGFDLSAFIQRCRLEEAKSLLGSSDLSLSEIAEKLCFSSQSYFQNVFKKKFGLTPMQYRNQTGISLREEIRNSD